MKLKKDQEVAFVHPALADSLQIMHGIATGGFFETEGTEMSRFSNHHVKKQIVCWEVVAMNPFNGQGETSWWVPEELFVTIKTNESSED